MNWVRGKIARWLGIDKQRMDIDTLLNEYNNLVSIGVDVHFKSPHMILVYSDLGGGQLRHIEASFDNLKELTEFVNSLRLRFKTNRVIFDSPVWLKGNEPKLPY